METAMTSARVVLAKALNQKAENLGENPSLGTTVEWDSLAHMRLILELESVLDRRLEPMEIVSISALCDVESILSKD